MIEKLRRRPRFGLLLVGVLSLALVGAACDDNGDNGLFEPADPAPADPVDPVEPTPADPADPADPAEPATEELRGEVVGVNGNAISGEVTVMDIEGQTNLIVMVAGIEEGTYAHEIRAGSCAAPSEEPLHSLAPALEADADGSASTASTVDAPIDELSTSHYYVVFDDEAGTEVACADLEVDPGFDELPAPDPDDDVNGLNGETEENGGA